MSNDLVGFGLAHLKGEGQPIHPDDLLVAGCDLSDEQYARQLKAYNEAYGLAEVKPH